MTSELLDKMGDQKTLGLQMPAGGTLMIGTQPFNLSSGPFELQDFMIDNVVLQSVVTPLPSNFGPYDQLYDPNAPLSWRTTYLSAQQLSSAGLTNLQIASNRTITLNADAQYLPGVRDWRRRRRRHSGGKYYPATLFLTARAIYLYGDITIPSGRVFLTATDNKFAEEYEQDGQTPDPSYVPMASVIELEPGAKST